MEKVLLIGVITIPLVMFLAYFGQGIIGDTQTNASKAKSKTATFATAAGKDWDF